MPAVDLPVLLPLTGNIAFIGMTVKRTLQAVERATNADGGIQGHPVHFSFYDDQASPVTALQLVASLPKDAPAVFDAGPLATCRVTSGALRAGLMRAKTAERLWPSSTTNVLSAKSKVAEPSQPPMSSLRRRGFYGEQTSRKVAARWNGGNGPGLTTKAQGRSNPFVP